MRTSNLYGLKVTGSIPVQRWPTPQGTGDSVDGLGVHSSSLSFIGEGFQDLKKIPSPHHSPNHFLFQLTGVNLVDKIWLTGRVVCLHG